MIDYDFDEIRKWSTDATIEFGRENSNHVLDSAFTVADYRFWVYQMHDERGIV